MFDREDPDKEDIDREDIEKFLEWDFEGLELPEDISKEVLYDLLSQYMADDYNEWLKENFDKFFISDEPN